MNCFITDSLHETITVGDKAYMVDTDFRAWIKFGNLMSQAEDRPVDSATEAIILCVRAQTLPPNVYDTLEALLAFYGAGLSGSGQTENHSRGNYSGKRVYDFFLDAQYIYAAFMSQYRIDLTTAEMHWFKFCALFLGLSDSEKISKIIEYRSAKLSEIKDRKQKAFIRKMQEIYRLPDNRSESEKHQSMIASLDKLI